MDQIVNHLSDALGPLWTVKAISRRDCEITGEFDPPCAFIRISVLGAEMTVNDQGEVFLPKSIAEVDMTCPPQSVASQIVTVIQETK